MANKDKKIFSVSSVVNDLPGGSELKFPVAFAVARARAAGL